MSRCGCELILKTKDGEYVINPCDEHSKGMPVK